MITLVPEPVPQTRVELDIDTGGRNPTISCQMQSQPEKLV